MRCRPSMRPAPRHSGQRSRTTSPAPPQASQGRLMRKNPCWSTTCPVPRQRSQRSGWVPGRAPLPPQGSQGRVLGISISQVGAALSPAAGAAAAGAEEIPEEVVEDVAEVAEVAEVLEARAAGGADAFVPEAVVGPALVPVGEHRVGLRRLLEALLGLGVVRVAVGVVLESELAIGGLQRGVVRAPGNSEDFVVIALGHVREPRGRATVRDPEHRAQPGTQPRGSLRGLSWRNRPPRAPRTDSRSSCR